MGISAKTTVITWLAAAALSGAPAHAAEPAISEQPADTPRARATEMQWTGGSSAQDVVVEYRSGLFWVPVVQDGETRLVVTDDGDGAWTAQWVPTRWSPAGTYRMRVEADGYTLTSEEFEVKPCECVVPHPLRVRWRKGAFRVRLTAEYQPQNAAGIELLSVVETGRPVVRVLRDGRRIGSLRLRYKRGAFRGAWRGPRGPQHSLVFELVSMTDAFGNR